MSMFADNPDFFPTPRQIARKMLARITNKEAKYFLEPSAGKGDIADVIRNPCTFEEFEEEHPEYAERNRTRGYDSYGWGNNRHSRVNIDVLESYPALIQVLRGKEYDVVGYDCLPVPKCESVLVAKWRAMSTRGTIGRRKFLSMDELSPHKRPSR